MGEYMTVRSRSLVPYSGLDPVTACITEPLAVCITAVENAEIPLGGSVVVLGPGPLGLMSARLAQVRGAGFVAVVGLAADNPCRSARLQAAQDLGCDMVLEIGRQDIQAEIRRVFPTGVDRVIVSAPPDSIRDALSLVRFGGIVTFFGLHFGGKSQIALDANDLIFRKITLKPTFAEPAIHFPTSISLLRSGLFDAGPLVTHTFGFGEAANMIGSIIRGDKPIVKAVMRPHG
jgi:L-iditol 2-dehydrogenase